MPPAEDKEQARVGWGVIKTHNQIGGFVFGQRSTLSTFSQISKHRALVLAREWRSVPESHA